MKTVRDKTPHTDRLNASARRSSHQSTLPSASIKSSETFYREGQAAQVREMIDNSPRMAVQRMRLHRMFGGIVQSQQDRREPSSHHPPFGVHQLANVKAAARQEAEAKKWTIAKT